MSYFVHVVRMQRERYSSVMLYGHTAGSRARGRPGQKWIDDIRDGCSDLGLTLLEATTTRLADNRRAWRSAARDASQHVVISSSSSGHHSLAGCTVTRGLCRQVRSCTLYSDSGKISHQHGDARRPETGPFKNVSLYTG